MKWLNPSVGSSATVREFHMSTGTDMKSIKCLIFMREVKSQNYFEQIKYLSARMLNRDDLKKF